MASTNAAATNTASPTSEGVNRNAQATTDEERMMNVQSEGSTVTLLSPLVRVCISIICIVFYSDFAVAEEQIRGGLATQAWKQNTSLPYVVLGTLCGIVASFTIFCIYCVRRRIHTDQPTNIAGDHIADLGAPVAPVGPGLGTAVVESLPLLTFSLDAGIGYDPISCHICLEDFQEGNRIRLLPSCNHVYHPHCVDPYLISRGSRCPVCRFDYATLGLPVAPPDIV